MKRVVVIGGGPGGYVAAIRAAQLGADVTLIEKERLGGVCLNEGCIPTKALLGSAMLYAKARAGMRFGVTCEPSFSWDKVQENKLAVVEKLVSGVSSLLRANGVKVVEGFASFADRGSVSVRTGGGRQTISGDSFIIASGSQPVKLGIEGTQLDGVLDSAQALSLESVPKSMLIVGGGVIGAEMATVYSSFGTEVTIVEAMPSILPQMDAWLSERAAESLKKRMAVMTGTKLLSIQKADGSLSVRAGTPEGEKTILAEKILICTGRRPATAGLELQNAGITCEKDAVPVDEEMRTNADHIFAIGDCTGRSMLAHAASAQGETAAKNALGGHERYDARTCPSCVYTNPEIASVGATERELDGKGIRYKKGVFPFGANGRALTLGEEGEVRVLADEKYGEILGVHIFGPEATELIALAGLAIRLEATLDEFESTIFAHPTLCEAVREAAMAANKIAIHKINR